MAEVTKKKKNEKYDVSEMIDSKDKKNTKKPKESNSNKGKSKNDKNNEPSKKSLWVRFRIFCHGVASEFKKVHWPTKYNMVKYSIAVIVLIIFLAILFYIIDILFALAQTLI